MLPGCVVASLGVKGCGEVGAIGSPPAVINAVVDALRDYKVRHVEMPATPGKIWSIIHAGGGAMLPCAACQALPNERSSSPMHRIGRRLAATSAPAPG